MAYEVSTYISCPAIQERLITLVGENDRTSYRKTPAVLSALVSPENTSGAGVTLRQRVDKGNGRKGEVQAIYSPELCADGNSDTPLNACDEGAEVGDLTHTWEVDPNVGTWRNGKLTLEALLDTCESDEFYAARVIEKLMKAVIAEMNTKSIAEMGTLFGANRNTGTTAAEVVKTQNGDNFTDDMATRMAFLLQTSGYNTRGWAFGGSFDFFRYYKAIGLACCTDVLNFDLGTYASATGPMPIFDEEIGAANWGANHVGLMVPGALQLLTFNRNRGASGIRVINQPTEKWGVITDPVTGIAFDYSAKFDCGVWNFSVGVAHQVVGMPEDMFYACSPLAGTTGFWDFQIVNPS